MAKKKVDGTESFDQFLERQYGKGVLITANDIVDRPREVLPTVLSLDIALSGGIPSGVTAMISGKAKVGKTSLCLQILKNAIDRNRPAFYVDIERRCSPSLIKTVHGLDASKLKVVRSPSDNILSAADWLNILERVIKDNTNAVIVVDSLAMLSTLEEQSELIGEVRDMAGAPKLLASFFRRMQQIIDNNNIILIFISQLITNRDPMSKSKYNEKGGMAVQYSNSVWLNINWTKLWQKDASSNAPLGQDMQINVNCSALGPPFLPCAVPLKFGSGVDVCRDLAINAENFGLIEKAGSWYSIPMFKDDKGEPIKFQGIEKICDFLKENPDKMKVIDAQIRNMILPDIKYAS